MFAGPARVAAMTTPISVDLPHRLGKEEARRRIASGMGGIKDHIPGGAAQVEQRWNGDELDLRVAAMGQEVTARIRVEETLVHLDALLPPSLSFFGRAIEAGLRKGGAQLLEDKTKRP